MHDDDHAGGCVYTTAMRLCSKRRTGLAGKSSATWSSVHRSRDDIGTVLDRAEVFAALARLSLRQRQAVTLRDWAGFETDELHRSSA